MYKDSFSRELTSLVKCKTFPDAFHNIDGFWIVYLCFIWLREQSKSRDLQFPY